MTENILPTASRTVSALPGMDHGWVRKSPRAFALWRWSPRELDRRGRRVGREDERAYRDLQAAADAASWREDRPQS